jgi:magnesium chelatase subunit I
MKLEQKKKQERPVFPFSGIVGQTEMKLALILNVIDPKIGGVLVMGDRGTGKSTTVRALADLLPEIDVVAGDKFNSDPKDPEGMSDEIREALFLWEQAQAATETSTERSILDFEGNATKAGAEPVLPIGGRAGGPFLLSKMKIPMVDLPLGATEDRVCGTIDIEKALTEGVKAFEPGLLAKANRGILYVDEVNLLDDHLVDVLLDSAASGWNTVEREGISIRHPARFILVGSGNPEEGELRPQLLDRFGMLAQIGTVKEPELRVKIVEQRTAFDQDPEIFLKDFIPSQNELRAKIINARSILPQVRLDYELRVNISKICSELNVDGLRGDIVCSRAAKAIAAFDGRTKVTPQDIYQIISLCLRHRLRKDPLESIDSGVKVVEAFSKTFEL